MKKDISASNGAKTFLDDEGKILAMSREKGTPTLLLSIDLSDINLH